MWNMTLSYCDLPGDVREMTFAAADERNVHVIARNTPNVYIVFVFEGYFNIKEPSPISPFLGKIKIILLHTNLDTCNLNWVKH